MSALACNDCKHIGIILIIGGSKIREYRHRARLDLCVCDGQRHVWLAGFARFVPGTADDDRAVDNLHIRSFRADAVSVPQWTKRNRPLEIQELQCALVGVVAGLG